MCRFTAGAKSAGMKRNPSSNCRETYGLIRHTVCMDERHLHVVEPVTGRVAHRAKFDCTHACRYVSNAVAVKGP